jgi:hypothetical protein
MIQFIVELPEDTKAELLSEDVKNVLQAFNAQLPDERLCNTKSVDGFELRLLMADVDPVTFQEVLALTYNTVDENDEDVSIDLGLEWDLLANSAEKVDQELLIPYFVDNVIFDEDGEQIDSEPVTDITGKLQSFAGKKWIY